MKYVASHRAIGAASHLLVHEPLIGLGKLGPDESNINLLTGSQHAELRRSLLASAKDIIEAHERIRQENLDKKIRRILQYCQEQLVDIVVFPECSIPTKLTASLLGFHLTVFADVGLLGRQDVRILGDLGFPVSDDLIGCNAALYASAHEKWIITKKHPAEGEDIREGGGVRIAGVEGHDRRTVGLAICKDYLRDNSLLERQEDRVDAGTNHYVDQADWRLCGPAAQRLY
jgi:hypothetical protein